MGKLENLVAGYPAEKNIIAAYAEGLANMCFEDEEITVARAAERLQELVEEYPNSDKIREQYERALENLDPDSWQENETEGVTGFGAAEPEAAGSEEGKALPLYAGSFAVQDLNQEQQEAVETVQQLQNFFLKHPEDTEAEAAFARGLSGLCGIPGALGWQASAMLEYLLADYPEEDVRKELAKGWILLSRVVDEMSAVMINARLEGLIMLNPDLADVVKVYKGELDKAE